MAEVVKSAHRALAIMEIFARHQRPLALKEIIEESGYPTSSGSALMKSLVAQGYVDYDRERRSYFPTMRIAALGSWVPGILFGDGHLLSGLEALHDRTGQAVVLAVQSDLQAQYVHVIDPKNPLPIKVPPGARRPLELSGLGIVLLAGKPDAEIERLRRRINAARRSPPQSNDDLMRRVNAVRALGYAFSKHGISPGIGIIGASLPKGPFGRAFAVGVAGLVDDLEKDQRMIVQALQRMIGRLA